MASSLSRQLAGIAATSTKQLDLRAQRHAHSQSLLFDPKVAATQDFDTIYDYCIDGFRDLCRLDTRFTTFSTTIFSEFSKTKERGQLTAAENEELDLALERFLTLSCRHILLQPTQKALEWLVRRFRIHEKNTETLVLTFLIYHTLPIFSTLLSILPKQLPRSLKFLHPYRERLQVVPGDVVQYATTTNAAFSDLWTAYIFKSCQWGFQHESMLSYWTIRMAAAVEAQLEPAKSGGAQAHRQREEDVVRKVTTILDKGLSYRRVSSMLIGCYIILQRLVLAANLNDSVVSTFMDAIVSTATKEVRDEALLGLIILAQKRKTRRLSQATFDYVMNMDGLVTRLSERSTLSDAFALCLSMELLQQLLIADDANSRQLIVEMLNSGLLKDDSLDRLLRTLIKLSEESQSSGQTTPGVQDIIHDLANSGPSQRVQTMLRTILNGSEIQPSLEAALSSMLESTVNVDEIRMLEDKPHTQRIPKSSTNWIKLMPTNSHQHSSFLILADDQIYNQLSSAFTKLLENSGPIESFLQSEFLGPEKASSNPKYLSFFARYWSSPNPAPYRAKAISLVTKAISDVSMPLNLQQLLPYTLIALADNSKAVRIAAADMLLQMSRSCSGAVEEQQLTWNAWAFYDSDEKMIPLTMSQLSKFLHDSLAPSLEEFTIDASTIIRVLHSSLSSSSSASESVPAEKLKKSTKAALLKFLADHARITPVLRVTAGLVKITSLTHKAGGMTRFEAFQTLLEAWIKISEEDLGAACAREKLGVQSFCSEMVQIVQPTSVSGNQTLQRFATSALSTTVVDAAFSHLQTSWPKMDSSIQSGWANLLFEHGILHRNDSQLSRSALDILSSLQLSSEILEEFITAIISSIPEPEESSPTAKRRRTSHGATSVADNPSSKEIKSQLTRITSTLDLIRSAGSQARYNLLPGLFRVFQGVQRSKTSLENDLTYAHWLLMTCLREVVNNTARTDLARLDNSDMRVDLIVDTLTHTADPQTQHAALLLLSSLAKLEPELIIHSMMPVFTFIGSSVLKQDDDHATHVIDQTIESVIPPLIASFKKQKGGALAGAASLILSFVAAFEHILPNRRLDLFTTLIDKLGPEDYLGVLFVVLRDRHGKKEGVQHFISELLLKFAASVQFKTIQNCLNILNDALLPRPVLLKQIFVTDDGQTHANRVTGLSELPVELLQTPRLEAKVIKALRSNGDDAQTVRSSYAEMVQATLKLSLEVNDSPQLTSSIAAILAALIGFFPVSESLRALSTVLKQPDENLHRVVLHSFASTIQGTKAGDVESRKVCFELLPLLVNVVQSSKDSTLKRSAILCVSGIVEKYGKVDIDRTLEIATFVAGPYCLQSTNGIVEVASLQALTSMAAILGEAIVPICPMVMSKALDLLASAVSEAAWNSDIHDATYSFFHALISTIPWILTGDRLDRLLELSYISASNSSSDTCDTIRVNTLDAFSKRASAQTCFSALARNWNRAVDIAGEATGEHFRILETAIEKHNKPAIVANATVLVDHFIEILNVRASRLDPGSDDWDEDEVTAVEETVSDLFIKMVYKLNDTHFRPQFIRMSEWATSTRIKNETTRTRRLTSWFNLLHKFFDTLQSVVTNYTSYVVDSIVGVLKTVIPDQSDLGLLWNKSIQTLHATFEHDQDDFWKSPARFTDVCEPLISQLRHGSILEDNTTLIPCITAFAVAVESPEHRAEIHSKILQHFKSDDARVRKAMFSCEISITEALGEEWTLLFESSSTYPVMSEAFEDDDEEVENEARRWKIQIEDMTGENLDTRLQ